MSTSPKGTELMVRYVTRFFATDDPSQIQLLCALDQTAHAEFKVTPDVTVLHVRPHWSYWSDGKIIRRKSSMQENRYCLSDAAVHLIDSVVGANRGQVEGGVATLTRIAEIIDKQLLVEALSGRTHRPLILGRLRVLLTEGGEADVYFLAEKDSSGYEFDVYWSRQSAERDLAECVGTRAAPASN